MYQYIHFSTHISGSSIDVIITSSNSCLISNSEQSLLISDHVTNTFALTVSTPTDFPITRYSYYKYIFLIPCLPT